MFHFCTPWKYQKIFGCLIFLGGAEEALGENGLNYTFIGFIYIFNIFYLDLILFLIVYRLYIFSFLNF